MSGGVCRAAAIALTGLEGTTVLVEAAVSQQLPGMAIIGLPDTALAEAKLRVRTATAQAGLPLSDRFLTVNLSPASIPKHGSGFDLAIALASLAASGRLPAERLPSTAHIGELGLDGGLRRPAGLLSAVLAARGLGFETVMVPESCAQEAALVPGIGVVAVPDLAGAVAWHRGEEQGWRIAARQDEGTEAGSGAAAAPDPDGERTAPDIADIVGQPEAVEALTIAAAGRHHLSMVGPPGAGKTMLATRLPTILPDLTPEESLTASSIASLGGSPLTGLVTRPPFESPHHTASAVSLIGGGDSRGVRPGAITRACYGALFLDEVAEFARTALDNLRESLESGVVEIHRARVRTLLPAKVQLIIASNPCPCGNADSPEPAIECTCTATARMRYRQRVSGPLQDRIDLRLSLRRVSSVLHLVDTAPRPTSAEIRGRVIEARAHAADRLRGTPWSTNAEVSGAWLRSRRMRLPSSDTSVLDRALSRGALTARGYDRTLRVHRTTNYHKCMSGALKAGAKAGLYWRQSVDEKDGIERQRKKTRMMAKAREYVVAATYEDNATSASKGRGTAKWAQLLDDAAAKRIDVVIAVDVDRLLRSITDLADLMRTGVRVLTVDGEIDLTSADGELRATMLAAVARFEVRRKSERQKRANEQRAAKGLRVGGRRPFGYEKDGVTVRRTEADAIVQGYRMIARGESLSAVARAWNDAGFTTGQSKRLSKAEKEAGKAPEPSPWTRSGVRDVMLNRRNIGQLVYLGEVQSAPAQWEPILQGDDADLFEQVQSILLDPGRRRPGRNPVGLLTGVAVCGVCGATVHAGGNARRGVRGYRCSGSTGHFSRMAEPVEGYVSRIVVRRLARKDAIRLLSPSKSVDARKLRAEERRLRERLDALAAEFAKPNSALTASQLGIASKGIKDQLAAIQAELSDAGRVDLLGELVGLGGDSEQSREAAVRVVWEGLGIERQREVVRELLIVTLHPVGRGVRTFRPETVGIEWVEAK